VTESGEGSSEPTHFSQILLISWPGGGLKNVIFKKLSQDIIHSILVITETSKTISKWQYVLNSYVLCTVLRDLHSLTY
jgi:hypothetical protein